MNKNAKPGPWEVDDLGRRFRRIGPGMVEYATKVTTTFGTFDQDELDGMERLEKTSFESVKEETTQYCPFSTAIDSKCREDCARHGMTGCGFVTGEPSHVGSLCPLPGRMACRNDCALWKLCNK